MQEEALIADILAPLSVAVWRDEAEAFGLSDDAALLKAANVVVTTDTLAENVHFYDDDPLPLVLRKALRVNLSDLAAKGARPLAYMTALTLRRGAYAVEDWREAANALAEEQRYYNLALLGGDTASHVGPTVITVTMFGEISAETPPLRRNLRAGDGIYVTGSIGDSALLPAMRRDPERFSSLSRASSDYVLDRYMLPRPRVEACEWIGRYAAASMDVSDGLIADAGKMAKAAGCGVSLFCDAVPRSEALKEAFNLGVYSPELADSGGDDYEILFSLRDKAALRHFPPDIPVTHIGEAFAGSGVTFSGVRAPHYRALSAQGYSHGL